MGVLDVYLSFSPEYLAAIQLSGILRAEQKLDSGEPSKLFVRNGGVLTGDQNTLFITSMDMRA